jgi:hypothetical protein
MTMMDKHVCFLVYGDDFLASVSDAAKEFFNRITLAEFFAGHGIGFTPADKTGKVVPTSPWNETTFLKRHWKMHETRNIVVAPLHIPTAIEEINWIRMCPDVEEALRENIRNSLRHMWGHGREQYEAYRGKVNRELKRVELEPVQLGFSELDEEMFGA